MAVVARFTVHEITTTAYGTKVNLSPLFTSDTNDPHYDEIKSFWDSTPQGQFWMQVKNDVAAEQFQVGDSYYITLERISD